jgi:hypothetical protein
MNTQDMEADALIAEQAPTTHAWIVRIRDDGMNRAHASGSAELRMGPGLQLLLAEICRTFVPLMRQNETAYERHLADGETLFNEAAFDQGRGLYKGRIDGLSFRSVVKTFQVKVWRNLLDLWWGLAPADREAFPEFAAAISDGGE